MAQFLFNVQNIKMIFILAAGLYSWNFLRKQRNINQQTKIKAQNQKRLQEKLTRINLDECNMDQIYQIFKGIDQNNKKDMSQKTLTSDREQNHQNCNGLDNNKLKNQQLDIEDELNKILSEKLMKKISKSSSLQAIKCQWAKKWGNPILNQNQPEQLLGNLQNMRRIKSSKQNNIKMQDAICAIQLPKHDDSFQFFPRIRQNTMMDVQDKFTLLERQKLRTNYECLQQAHRIVPKHKNIIKEKYKTPKRKYKREKINKRYIFTPQNKQNLFDNQKTETQSRNLAANIFINDIPNIQLATKKKSQCTCRCGNSASKLNSSQDANKMQDQTLQNINIPNFPTQKIQRIKKTQICYEF